MADAKTQTKTDKPVDPKNVDIEAAAAISAGEFLSEPGTVTVLSNGTTVRSN